MKKSLLSQWLHDFSDRICRRALLTVVLCLLTAGLALALAAERLRISTDRSHLIGAEQPVARAWERSRQMFGAPDDMIVLIQGAEGREGVGQLAAFLENDSEWFEPPLFALDLPQLRSQSLYFLSLTDLEHLSREIARSRNWLSHLGEGLGGLLGAVADTDRASLQKELGNSLGLLCRLLQQLAVSLETRGQGRYLSPLGTYESDLDVLRANRVRPGQSHYYSMLVDGQTYVLFVRPRHRTGFDQAIRNLERLRHWVGLMHRSHPQISSYLSGEPVIYTDEMRGAWQDLVKAFFWALLLVSVLVTLALGSLWRAAAVAASLSVALSWALGWAALTAPELNLYTASVFSLLVGAGLTMMVPLAYRYQWERGCEERRPCNTGLRHTLGDLGPPLIYGTFACALVFLLLNLTRLETLHEFGRLAAGGMMLCALSAFVFLPALLACLDRLDRGLRRPWWGARWTVAASQLPRNFRFLSVLVLTVVSVVGLSSLSVDYSQLNLQARNSPLYKVEALLQKRGYSNLYAISVAPSLEKAVDMQQRFQELSSVSRVESLVSLLPRQVEQKQPYVDRVVAEVGKLPIPGPPPPRTAGQLLELYEQYRRTDRLLRELIPAWKAEGKQDAARLERLLDRVSKAMDIGNPGPVEEGLLAFEQRFSDDLREQLKFLREQVNRPPQVLGLLPKSLRSRSISPEGFVLMRIFPAGDSWQRENLERFVTQVRSVDPDATGNPVLMFEFTEQLREALETWGKLTGVLLLGWLLAGRRTWSQILGTFVVAGMAALWTLGLVGYSGRPLNALTLLGMPVLVCLGLVFAMLANMGRWSHPERALHIFPPSYLAGFAWMVGFASLLGSEHQGLSSFGEVATLGVAMNLLAVVLLSPPGSGRQALDTRQS